jgi:hypothetical protein
LPTDRKWERNEKGHRKSSFLGVKSEYIIDPEGGSTDQTMTTGTIALDMSLGLDGKGREGYIS